MVAVKTFAEAHNENHTLKPVNAKEHLSSLNGRAKRCWLQIWLQQEYAVTVSRNQVSSASHLSAPLLASLPVSKRIKVTAKLLRKILKYSSLNRFIPFYIIM